MKGSSSVVVPVLLSFSFSFGQESPSFFPHHLGDMWEYLYCWEIGKCDTIQVHVIKDSVDQNEISHVLTEAYLINPTEPPHQFFEDTNYYRVDTLDRVYRDELGGFKLRYNLNAEQGDLWIIDEFQGWYDVARVEDIYDGTVLGLQVTFMEIAYYSTGDTSDTTVWLHNYTSILASGLGLEWAGGGDAFAELHLIGAVIDGILYGDTTTVTLLDPYSGRIIPDQVQLLQNYPNPFNSSTVIPFLLHRKGSVTLRIYDVTGRLVANLIDRKILDRGLNKVLWNGIDGAGYPSSSGIYFYQLRTGGRIVSKTMLLVQ